jgi:hypothetical protein
MAGSDRSLYGTDKDTDFRDFLESIKNFHFQWLRDEIKRTCDDPARFNPGKITSKIPLNVQLIAFIGY